jgi:hypothetical protein
MVLSGIGFLLSLPVICNAKFLRGLYTLATSVAYTFYFVAYLFLSLDPSFFNIFTWALLGLSALTCIIGMIFTAEASGRFGALIGHAPQLVFFILVLLGIGA